MVPAADLDRRHKRRFLEEYNGDTLEHAYLYCEWSYGEPCPTRYVGRIFASANLVILFRVDRDGVRETRPS